MNLKKQMSTTPVTPAVFTEEYVNNLLAQLALRDSQLALCETQKEALAIQVDKDKAEKAEFIKTVSFCYAEIKAKRMCPEGMSQKQLEVAFLELLYRLLAETRTDYIKSLSPLQF